MDIKKIRGYVDENAAGIREVWDIASKFGVSADSLRKTFRRVVGIPLSEYIILRKVSEAKVLREKTDMMCFQICFKVGFAREDSGLRAFKRLVGMTMIQYRVASRNNLPVRHVAEAYPAVLAFCTG